MRNRASLLLFLVAGIVFAQSETRLRLDSHSYAGPRGTEPGQQANLLLYPIWSQPNTWEVSALFETELLGSKDRNLDLPRFWYRWRTDLGELTLGRIHPKDISLHPDAHQPFGLLSSAEAQNQSLLLGSGLGVGVQPEPILNGWVGVHYWNQDAKNFAWGVSLSPLFVPTLGPRLDLEAGDNRVGRFGRRPPGYVELSNGKVYPLTYDLDDTGLVERTLLQPQMLVHARFHTKPMTLWWELKRAPVAEPIARTEGFLRISDTTLTPVAIVRPSFPEIWTTALRQRWAISEFFALENALEWSERGWGWELGVLHKNISLTFLNMQERKNLGTGANEHLYRDMLLQLAVQGEVLGGVPFVQIKHHLTQNDLWLRGGVRVLLNPDLAAEVGADVFAGNAESYFGEWRSNDRVFLSLLWSLGP